MPRQTSQCVRVSVFRACFQPGPKHTDPERSAFASQWPSMQCAEQQQPFQQQLAEDLGFSWSHDAPSVPGASNIHARTNALRQRKGDKMAAGYL